ncbi:hypothetical protein P4S95_24525 [Aneurinibacillus aneurinilyticus]|nr:hypothetical protein [Aneurinibacillus aneurinilyticus]MED0673344.1 hypothetical protein [Aneurinibacillus aneurinilyticus]
MDTENQECKNKTNAFYIELQSIQLTREQGESVTQTAQELGLSEN